MTSGGFGRNNSGLGAAHRALQARGFAAPSFAKPLRGLPDRQRLPILRRFSVFGTCSVC